MAEDGFIVISDITGYTAYLSESELEHAQDSLHNLLQLLIQETRAPLVISRLEGDAVISYAPGRSLLQGQSLVEIVENAYVAFRQARQRMELNTTCPCDACRNIPNLDLKFLVHHGSYVVQEMGPQKELVGSDVNLAHRLLKNSITEQTGIRAYAAYTTAAVEELGIAEFCSKMQQHSEEYEHLGVVDMYVQDLGVVWDREKERRRIFVDPSDALYVHEVRFPASAPIAWDYFTKPEMRALHMGADDMTVGDLSEGRLADGSVYYCAHGDVRLPQAVLDWHPFDYFTCESATPEEGVTARLTVQFAPEEGSTRITQMMGHPTGPFFKRRRVAKYLLGPFQEASNRGMEAIRDRFLKDLEEGITLDPRGPTPTEDQVRSAVSERLQTERTDG